MTHNQERREKLREAFAEKFGYELGAEGDWIEPVMENKIAAWWLNRLDQEVELALVEEREKVRKQLKEGIEEHVDWGNELSTGEEVKDDIIAYLDKALFASDKQEWR